jgi:CRISPR-associated endonuclease/helicase Cas3
LIYYAHSRGGADSSDWHRLEDHLQSTAERARRFAEKFQSGEWGYLAGLWHDLGKYDSRFQQKLNGVSARVDHSVVGAAAAVSRFRNHGLYVAFPIAGHHAGLADLRGDEPPTQLATRLADYRGLTELLALIPKGMMERPLPPLPSSLQYSLSTAGPPPALVRRTEFWIRFLFSTLVDADWLDTEAFFEPDRGEARRGFSPLRDFCHRLSGYIAQKTAQVPIEQRETRITQVRNAVLVACDRAAELSPGFFSLTAPTGAGKTLAAMTFALRHAARYGMARVIVVLPYTSIIEQNAAVYRIALGSDEVVEHHSNFDAEGQAGDLGEEVTARHKLAAENWDAPVVVTTTVQFFESLFANRPSKCRKLHNIARSVIALDEVQALPNGFLLSILDALNELVTNYGCTVVLSTATPPALERRPGFEMGLEGMRHIISDPASLSRTLHRVEFHWPSLNEPATKWDFLAGEIAGAPRAMAIVHRRRDARDLARLVAGLRPQDPIFHLSALMCAAHRSKKLTEVRSALAQRGPCRLVATQLVEAGVDIDFPVVWRSLGGLDSIVQAAGRCNREGRQATGHVFIYRSPTAPPRGTPRKAADVAEAMLTEHGGAMDLDDPGIFDSYFRRLYMLEDQDKRHIQTLRQEFRFASVAREFQMIEDGFDLGIIVPYGGAPEALQDIGTHGATRDTLRRLQRYSVQIPTRSFEELQQIGAIEEVVPGVFVLANEHRSLYDDRFGLVIEDEPEGESHGEKQ